MSLKSLAKPARNDKSNNHSSSHHFWQLCFSSPLSFKKHFIWSSLSKTNKFVSVLKYVHIQIYLSLIFKIVFVPSSKMRVKICHWTNFPWTDFTILKAHNSLPVESFCLSTLADKKCRIGKNQGSLHTICRDQ